MAGFPSQIDKIMGELTYNTIRALLDNLEENVSSIDCPLGGGNEGYLRALLLAADHTAIPGTVPLVTPVNPSHTTPQLTSAAAAIANQERIYDKAYHQYHKYNGVTKAPGKQLVAAID
jgi:hypothetical protein